jgi:hypothetical protein
MRNLDAFTKLAGAVLLAAVWTSAGAWTGPDDTAARAVVAAWKDGDPGMAKVAEVIASAFAMSWAGTIEGRPVYCPPSTAPLTGNQLMSILERFVSDTPAAADNTYGFALSASLTRAFPCAPG